MLAIFLAITVAPLLAVAWLGMSYAREERAALNARLHEAALSNLRGSSREIEALVMQIRPDVSAVDPTSDPAVLRSFAAGDPLARQLVVVEQESGALVYPSPGAELTNAEEEFLRRTRELWAGNGIDTQQSAAKESAGAAESGWRVWYFGEGLNLIWWERVGPAHVVGVEIDSIALLSRIIALLPDSDAHSPELPYARVELLDTDSRVLYQWGGHEPGDEEAPLAELDLAPPLSSWKLQYLGSAPSAAIASGLVTWLFPLMIGIAALAFYFYRESSREMREAGQRVTFVNQVSHELKTPLTNIRMYAEILEDELSDEPRMQGFAGIIASESQRLARLILNLLSFSRSQREELQIRRTRGSVDEVVKRTLERFRPAFEAAAIEAEVEVAALQPTCFDADVLEQVLGNLLSNVEKYAREGGTVRVTTQQEGDEVRITVRDDGPGIPAAEVELIFEPFYRISNRLSEGVTGTGIGLSIARDLARAHDGELRLIETQDGASFELTLGCRAEPSQHRSVEANPRRRRTRAHPNR